MDACKLGTDQSMLPCALVLVDSRVNWYSRLLGSGLVFVLAAFVPTRPRTYVAARTYPPAHARSVVAPRVARGASLGDGSDLLKGRPLGNQPMFMSSE
jgi:hypothetical protein